MSRRKSIKRLSKNRFKSAFCSRCGLCNTGTEPAFCYNGLYRKDPNKFISKVFPQIITKKPVFEEIIKGNTAFNSVVTALFKKVFCDQGICTECPISVDSIRSCVNLFTLQANMTKSLTIGENFYKKKKKNKNKVKIISKPEVAIIISDNEKFKKEVNRILANNT